MMSRLKNFFVAIAIVLATGVVFSAIIPQNALAADVSDACNKGFLGFPAWYRGLTFAESDGSCGIVNPGNDLSRFIWKVALNVVEMAMLAIAYITVFFILFGGFQFLTSQGAPDGMAKARTTILNAVIGLVISLVAVGIINFIVTGLLI